MPRSPVDRPRLRPGYLHDALIFDTTDQLVTAALPFLVDGLEAGDDLVLACAPEHNELFRRLLGEPRVLDSAEQRQVYQRAPAAVGFFQRAAARAESGGAAGLRVLAEVPFGPDPDRWREWSRFEAVSNQVLRDLPIWSLCAYDTRTCRPAVLEAARRTHPTLRAGRDRRHNPEYVDPVRTLELLADPAVLDVEETVPTLELGVVDPRSARAALRRALPHAPGPASFLLAVDEVVTNALVHGRRPVTLRCWVGPRQVVCTVTDRGSGFADPFVGYWREEPGYAEEGPLHAGLWVARQLCDDLTTRRDDAGFTVRLTATRPPRFG